MKIAQLLWDYPKGMGQQGRLALCQQFSQVILGQMVPVEFQRDFGKCVSGTLGSLNSCYYRAPELENLGKKYEVRSRSERELLLGDITAATT